MQCAKCKAPVNRLFEVDGQWIGFECVPKDIRKMYPGWEQREQKRVARAAQARKNFSKTKETTTSV